jgi:glycosyltransferase involved in cell wall biosynthesis
MNDHSPVPGPRSPVPSTLRVLMLAPTPYFADRGCHVRIYEEARALIGLGHEVRIVTYHLGRDMAGIPTVRTLPVPWYRKLAAGPSWHKPYLDILLYFTARATARRFRPDVIHAHLHEGAFLGLYLKTALRVPLLFDCQGSLTAEMLDHGFIHRGSPLHQLFRIIEGRINSRSDFIVTSSRAGAAELTEDWRVPADRVRGVIDGVDTAVFRPFPREEARRALNLTADRPVAVFLGVLNSYQGIDLLLEVAQIMKLRGTAPHFLVMGFPEERYRRQAVASGLGDLMTFTGRVDYGEAPFYLCAGDIALSPKISLTEANGKLFNYMACGLPTVAFDNPVNREIMGETAVYARHGDPADFAARIEELLLDPEKRLELAGKVREKAERDHSWQARGEELVEIYRELLKSPCH